MRRGSNSNIFTAIRVQANIDGFEAREYPVLFVAVGASITITSDMAVENFIFWTSIHTSPRTINR